MAKRSRRVIHSSQDYRRLSPSELKAAGKGAGSKTRVLSTVKRVTKATPTISDRQYAQLRLQERLGQKTTKEQFNKAVRKGEAQYANMSARHASDARFVRQFIPNVAQRHLKVILKWYDAGGGGGAGWRSLDDKERETFRGIFSQYTRDDVRQALGSAPQDTGAFSIS